MKIFLLILFSVIPWYCIAQNYKIEKQYNNYYRHKKIDAQFVSTNEYIILHYHSCRSHFKTQEFEAWDIEQELQIEIPASSIQLNRRQLIPDSAISIKGTYFIYANWYDGFISYDSFQGFLKFRKIKKDSIKVHVYLIGIIDNTAYILINKKKIVFVEKQ